MKPAHRNVGQIYTPPNLFVIPYYVWDYIIWEDSVVGLLPYHNWSPSQKNTLWDQITAIKNKTYTPLPPAPPIKGVNIIKGIVPDPNSTIKTSNLPADDTWNYFIAHVAQSIVVQGTLPWSINNYAPDEIQFLDSRSLVRWDKNSKSYMIPFEFGWATPGDPVRTHNFLVQNKLIGKTREDTIANLLKWCTRLTHYKDNMTAQNAYDYWQYYGYPPVEYMIAGTVNNNLSNEIKHYTAGCHGTTGFLRGVLRTVNILVEDVEEEGHSCPHFVNEDKYLSHGDDLYFTGPNLMPSDPPIAMSELLVDQSTFSSWFGPNVSDDQKTINVGRQPGEISLKHITTQLLQIYCDDKKKKKTHNDGKVLAAFPQYTLQDLENMNLWKKMDAKINSLYSGDCGKIPPIVTIAGPDVITRKVSSTFNAQVSGGTSPYTYYWEGFPDPQSDSLTITYSLGASTISISVDVRDSNGIVNSATKALTVK